MNGQKRLNHVGKGGCKLFGLAIDLLHDDSPFDGQPPREVKRRAHGRKRLNDIGEGAFEAAKIERGGEQ